MAPLWLEGLLLQVSNTYHIEYHGYMSNHIAHGAIALEHLGANKERIQKFIDWYGFKTNSQDDPLYRDEHGEDGEDFSDISKLPIGTRRKFYPILEFIQDKIKANDGNYNKIVAEYFPKVSDGLACSLLHALIQLGYGLSAGCSRTVAEGLTYCYHSYMSAYLGDPQMSNSRSIGQFGKGKVDAIEVLQKVRDDKDLKQKLKESFKSKKVQECKQGPIVQTILAQFYGCSKELQAYVDTIRLPDYLDINNLNVDALGTWLVDLAMTVYASSEVKNDFFLVHGVTGAWSLKQILPLMADQKQEVLRAARTFLMTLVALYVTRRCYKLKAEQIELNKDNIDEQFWEDIKAEQVERTCDEHYYKLVQVAYDMWKDNKKNDKLYAACAKVCMENRMFMAPGFSYPLDDKTSDITTEDVQTKLLNSQPKRSE